MVVPDASTSCLIRRINPQILSATSAVLLVLCTARARAAAIWIEGERPAVNHCVRDSWYDDVDKSIMSGGEWQSHYHKTTAGEAIYGFVVAEDGPYTLWIRCNPFAAVLAMKIDDGPWTQVAFEHVRDRVMISEKHDHRFLAWVRAGNMALRRGAHRITFRFSSAIANHGGIDCFCFVNEPFIPSGPRRPGPRGAAAPDEWFEVVVGEDPFRSDSVIDVSSLLHHPAGRWGFLGRDRDALRFEHAAESVKFWGVNANVAHMTQMQQTRRVRYLAKHGVNVVRQHTLFEFLGPLRKGRLHVERIDRYDRWFAQLKQHGIYSTWSVFYPLVITAQDGYDPDLSAELERGRTYGVVNFSRPLQDMQLRYLHALLEHHNPYTGLSYKNDAALAFIEVHNEDCLFFHWPLNALATGKMPLHARMLRQLFCQWAKQQYGTDAALRRAWGTGDSLASGELRLHGAWEMKGDVRNARIGDFIRFLTQLQRGFYERRLQELRDIGFRALTVSTAWRAGGPGADAANLYCDTAMDAIDRHNYFGGGEGRHRIRVGGVHNGTHLAEAGSRVLSMGLYQVENMPFMTTEWTQMPPNQWKAELAPLMAFYGMGLQGWDVSCHYMSHGWRLGDGWPQKISYVTDTPHFMGQFPALALAIHRGHISEGPAAAARRLGAADLFTGLDPLGQDFTGGGLDRKQTRRILATPTAVLAIGRVTVGFDGGVSGRLDWDRYWDRDRGVVRSATGELEWDMQQRIVRVLTRKTQALIGFAGGTTQRLPAAIVSVKTPFVSLLLSPMDDRPLSESRSVLITALARDRQTGTTYNPEGSRLEAVGGPPLLLEPVQATIKLLGAPIQRVTVLDFHGAPTGRHVAVKDNTFTIDGTHRTYYYQVVR